MDLLTEPRPGFRFAVQIEGVTAGWFRECGGLSEEREVVPYAEGGVNDHVQQFPGRVKKSRITLKSGVVGTSLWDWFCSGQYDGCVRRRHLSVVVYGSNLMETARWDIPDAYPTKWSGPEFQANSDQIAVETLELSGGDGSAEALIQRSIHGTLAGISPGLGAGPGQRAAIDVNALATRVYELLARDLRVERERLGRRWL